MYRQIIVKLLKGKQKEYFLRQLEESKQASKKKKTNAFKEAMKPT